MPPRVAFVSLQLFFHNYTEKTRAERNLGPTSPPNFLFDSGSGCPSVPACSSSSFGQAHLHHGQGKSARYRRFLPRPGCLASQLHNALGAFPGACLDKGEPTVVSDELQLFSGTAVRMPAHGHPALHSRV